MTHYVLIALGILLTAIFVVLARSVRTAGIVRTDVAQRLSLFVSLFAAFVFLGDVLTTQKALGIGIALLAVACVLWRKRASAGEPGSWWAPVLVFAGFGAIDICFKLVAKAGASFAAGLLEDEGDRGVRPEPADQGGQFLRRPPGLGHVDRGGLRGERGRVRHDHDPDLLVGV